MTNDLRIADAPLLVDVSGEEKLPTGGYGNYSTTINQIADFTQLKWKLATEGYVDNKVSIVNTSLNNHISNKTNPHGVTKEQVGLGEVNNTADLDKPVSAYQRTAIDEKVAKTSIVDNLATNDSTKILSARQGKVLQDTKASKTDVDVSLDLKADKSQVYTKDEVYSKDETLTLEREDLYVITESGRKQREKNTDYITTKDFGAVCDGTYHPLSEFFKTLQVAQVKYPFVTSLEQSIDDVALQQALNTVPSYKNIIIDGVHVAFSTNTASSSPIITSTTANRVIIFNGKVTAVNDVKLFISLDAENTYLKINADGQEKYLSNLVRVTEPNCTLSGGNIVNLFAPEFSAVAFTISNRGHGVKITNNTVKNLNAVGDGTLGNGRGMCRAVAFDLVSPTYQSIVEGNTFDSITGEEGDAVTVVAKDSGGNYTNAKVTIRKNKIGNVNRRHVKVQANDVSIRRNYFYQTDDSIVLTNIQTVVDFVEGSNHKVTDNEFDSIKNFAQISVYQTNSSKPQSLITIKRNEFKGLKDSANTKNVISLSSVGATRFIVKDNDITCGTGRAISLGGAATVLVKGNDIDGLDNANESFITLASTTKTTVVDNTFIDGVRQSCILDTATGTVYKDNINMTTAPLIRDVAGSRGSHTLNNICYASAIISGTSGYKGNYFYQNIRIDSADMSYQAPMFFAGTTPETYLLDAPVKKGQVIYSTNSISGSPIGYVAQANGKANEITWKGFGAIL